jgi:hypothetical protein
VLTYKEYWGYESGACGQANFRNMLRLLILNSERLSEAIPDPTGIDTLGLNFVGRENSNEKSKEMRWAWVAGRDVGRLAGYTTKARVRG